MLVGEITEREATRNPEKTALVEPDSGRQLSHRALHRRVAALHAALATAPGVRAGDRVALLSLNRIEAFEVYLGAARAGLVAQGLNWRLAADELERILRAGQPRVVVFDASFAELAGELRRRLDIPLWLSFGEGSDGSYEETVEIGARRGELAVEASPDDPALVIYTGGSSGESKGAVHTNRSLLAAMVNNSVAERIVPSDRYLLLGQVFHSASILALNYLMHGATVVLVPKFEPRRSLEVMESERVTTSLAFPAMVNYMLAEAGGGRFDLGSLRNVQYGGQTVAPRIILAMLETFACGLIQCYGSSEQVGVTFLSQEDHEEARRSAGKRHLLRSCGREAHLTRVFLVGDDGRLVPRDGRTPGEIVVRSPANMAGYWGRPDLTAAAMREPFGLGTGDLAVWDDEGYVYVVDRAKDMVISGGENIYPAQVEKAIAEHPDVLEAAVVGVPDEQWGEAVAAFVVLHRGSRAGADDIRQTVARTLGSYQKPRHVRFVEELPKTPAGKVAKRTLRAAIVTGADIGAAPSAPAA